MNRQIKFRIWNSKTSEWVHGPGKEVNLFGEMILLGGFMKNIPLTDWDDCVILQFTGLKDSMDTEIYEGDILKHAYPQNSPDNISVVSWSDSDDGELGVVGFRVYSLWTQGGPMKVVGNIFENKELIS